MRINLILLSLILVIGVTAACSPADDSSDGGYNGDVNNTTNNMNSLNSDVNNTYYGHNRTISLVGQNPISIGASEETDIVVKLSEEGTPVYGALLTFTILGDAGGATLDKDEVITNADGLGTVHLKAGTSQSEFQIKVRADNAPDFYIDVIVSETGFTKLVVETNSLLPQSSPDLDQVSIGVLFDTKCDEIDPFDVALMYTRYESEIPLSISYPALPSERNVSMVLFAKSGGHPLAYGCIFVPGEEMLPHATVSRKMDVLLYDPPLPQPAFCKATVDASSTRQPIEDEYRSLLNMGSCEYGLADKLVSELEKMGWMCLNEYQAPLDVYGCRQGGGLAEELTVASTAIAQVQDALSCLHDSVDGTALEQIPVGMSLVWEPADSELNPFDGTMTITLSSLGLQNEAFLEEDASIPLTARKLGDHISMQQTTLDVHWSYSVDRWLEGTCLSTISQPLSGQAILDYLRERVETESISAVHDVLCKGMECCPPEEALEQAWYAIRDDQNDGNSGYRDMRYSTTIGGSITIVDESHDSTPEGVQCNVDVSIDMQ